jgi:hypothetical protein
MAVSFGQRWRSSWSACWVFCSRGLVSQSPSRAPRSGSPRRRSERRASLVRGHAKSPAPQARSSRKPTDHCSERGKSEPRRSARTCSAPCRANASAALRQGRVKAGGVSNVSERERGRKRPLPPILALALASAHYSATEAMMGSRSISRQICEARSQTAFLRSRALGQSGLPAR